MDLLGDIRELNVGHAIGIIFIFAFVLLSFLIDNFTEKFERKQSYQSMIRRISKPVLHCEISRMTVRMKLLSPQVE